MEASGVRGRDGAEGSLSMPAGSPGPGFPLALASGEGPLSASSRKAPYEAGGEVVSLWWRRMAFGGHGQDPQTVPAPAPFPAKSGSPARLGGRR
jgi:hypothetical protein